MARSFHPTGVARAQLGDAREGCFGAVEVVLTEQGAPEGLGHPGGVAGAGTTRCRVEVSVTSSRRAEGATARAPPGSTGTRSSSQGRDGA
jgi:hypothetical protein